MIQPIGQVIFGGLSFGTLMTLTMMPIIYYIFNKGNEKHKIKRAIENKKLAMVDINEDLGEDK